MNLVSVIIPVYNVENDLEKCIESILNQTYTNLEVWLIDDGSKDNSPKICDVYEQKDSRVHVVHKQNAGVSAARNTGIERANGDYIMFVDSDDSIAPKAIEHMMERAESTQAEVVICGFHYYFMQEGTVRENIPSMQFEGDSERFLHTVFYDVLIKEFLNPPWNKLIKRELVERCGLRFHEDYSICEDMAFSIMLVHHARKIAILQEALYNYVLKSGESLVSKFHPNYFEALSFYMDCVKQYFEAMNAPNEVKSRMNEFLLER